MRSKHSIITSCLLSLFTSVVGKQAKSHLLIAIAAPVPVSYCCWHRVGVGVTRIRSWQQNDLIQSGEVLLTEKRLMGDFLIEKMQSKHQCKTREKFFLCYALVELFDINTA